MTIEIEQLWPVTGCLPGRLEDLSPTAVNTSRLFLYIAAITSVVRSCLRPRRLQPYMPQATSGTGKLV